MFCDPRQLVQRRHHRRLLWQARARLGDHIVSMITIEPRKLRNGGQRLTSGRAAISRGRDKIGQLRRVFAANGRKK